MVASTRDRSGSGRGGLRRHAQDRECSPFDALVDGQGVCSSSGEPSVEDRGEGVGLVAPPVAQVDVRVVGEVVSGERRCGCRGGRG